MRKQSARARAKIKSVQGGASTQFAAVPLNLMHSGSADYIVTGNFAKKACQEGQIYGAAHNIGGHILSGSPISERFAITMVTPAGARFFCAPAYITPKRAA